MKKALFIFLLALLSVSGQAQITKIDHFNAHSTEAAALYEFFTSHLRLPVVYAYQSYGNFSSGGLWLGNVTLEFVNYTGNPYTARAVFKGIALEPVNATDSIVALLDKSGVAHAAPVPTKFKVDGADKTFWTNTNLNDLCSADVRVFVCDYEDRAFVNTPKAAANDSLRAIQGGPLGIRGLKTIVLGVTNLEKASSEWAKTPGIKRVPHNGFQFAEGPDIRLQQADRDGVLEIQVQVKSKKAARRFLGQHQWLYREGASVLIDPGKINGLRILLTGQ